MSNTRLQPTGSSAATDPMGSPYSSSDSGDSSAPPSEAPPHDGLRTGVHSDHTGVMSAKEVQAAADFLTPKTRVGRYEIQSPIAEGGMGVVYRAYDPELARAVALKLLRPEHVPGKTSLELRRRFLQREAQALARVAHPNVIAVHDVGQWNGQVFVAMELVDGVTLREWLISQSRSLKEILQVLIGAGEGLAAAHRAGLIHRDFKPSNVLIAADDRARVLDFGLARAPETGVLEDAQQVTEVVTALFETDSHDLLETPLTIAGQIVGTPAYMAPEQQRGDTVDARTDQFAYCVVLYEAIFGERPFPARAFRHELTPTKPDFPSTRARLSGRMRRAISRGLEIDASRRFPSMEALLAELRKEIGQGRRALAIGATAVATAAVVWVPASQRDNPAAACIRSRDAISNTWNDRVKERLEGALLATKVPHAAETYDRVSAALDKYVGHWADMRQEACEATHMQAIQSADLLDRRTLCLDRARAELSALVQVLGENTDGAVVDKAVTAVHGLPDLDTCADGEALLAAYPPPDAAHRTSVEAANTHLDQATALRLAGRTKAALEAASSALTQAEALDYPPLTARALYLVGALTGELGQYDEARRHLRKAANTASLAHDDVLTAEAWTKLFTIVAVEQQHPDQAVFIEDGADQWALRAGNPMRLRASLLETKGHVAFWRGDFKEAEVHYRLKADMVTKHLGSSDPALAVAYNSIGAAVASQGKYGEASVVFEKAMDLGAESLGPRHPWVGLVTTNLGLLHQRLGNLDRAQALHEQALATYEQAYGEQHRRTALVLTNLAAVSMERGDYRAAEEAARRSIEIVEAVDGPNHPDLGNRLESLAAALVKQSRWDEAREAVERSLAVNDANHRQDHPDYANPVMGLGTLQYWQGDLENAESQYRHALRLREQTEGRTPEHLASLYLALATVREERGDLAEAETLIEKARQVSLEGLGANHPNLARADARLGAIRRAQGRLDDAIRLQESAMEEAKDRYPSTHPEIALAAFELAESLLAKGDGVRALDLLQHAQDALPPNHPSYPDVATAHGRAQLLTGDKKAAVETLQSAAALATTHGASPARQARSYRALAHALSQSNHPAAARKAARKAETLGRHTASSDLTRTNIARTEP